MNDCMLEPPEYAGAGKKTPIITTKRGMKTIPYGENHKSGNHYTGPVWDLKEDGANCQPF
jgi:hypothetical protein